MFLCCSALETEMNTAAVLVTSPLPLRLEQIPIQFAAAFLEFAKASKKFPICAAGNCRAEKAELRASQAPQQRQLL
jgi:hypothetical protein